MKKSYVWNGFDDYLTKKVKTDKQRQLETVKDCYLSF